MGVSLLSSCIYILDPVIYIIRKGVFHIHFGDIILVYHVLKNDLPSGIVVFRIGNGIISGRIGSNRCKDSTFCKSKVRNFFIKIPACGNLNSQGITAQVYSIQIVGDNGLFCFFFA